MQCYIKRIIKVKISITTETPGEILEKLKKEKFEEEIISDTFLVEDEKEMIIAKQKVIYDGVGKVLRFDHILR